MVRNGRCKEDNDEEDGGKAGRVGVDGGHQKFVNWYRNALFHPLPFCFMANARKISIGKFPSLGET